VSEPSPVLVDSPLRRRAAARRTTRAAWTPGRAAPNERDRPLDVAVLDVKLRQGLVAVQQLARAGMLVGAVECASTTPVPTFSSRWCGARAIVPDRETQPDGMVDALLDLVRQRSVRVIVPVHDGTIEAVNARRAEIERSCAIALGSPRALDAAVDKEKTLKIAADLGLRIPRGVLVDDENDVAAAIAEVGLPAVAKPTRSWVTANGEPHRLSPIAVVSLEESRAAVATLRAMGSGVVFQEWIPGAREAVSFVYAKGIFWGEFAQVARRMVPLLGGNSVARESVPLPDDTADGARRLIAEIGLEGYSEIEFRRDVRGVPVLMEINPRLSASVEVAVRAGIDFPRLVHAWATGSTLEQMSYRPGVRMRWLGGDIMWVLDNMRFRDRPDAVPVGRAVWAFAHDFTQPSGYDYLARDDLRPAAIATMSAARSAARSITKRLSKRTKIR
jgi:predicted ATP-grasp superfamily ATP-dependent carboligase